MERYTEITRPMDARMASWLAASSPATVGYHISCGMSLPEGKEAPQGLGPGWQGRALVTVLRECYRRGLSKPTLEEVEVVALSVLPEPEDDEGARPPFMPSAEQWREKAIRDVSEAMHRILVHGPASGAAGGERIFTGGTPSAEIMGLEIQERVDLIWRRPDGQIEAVLIFEEAIDDDGPQPVARDWRCILAAAVVRALYGPNPDLHTVWVSEPAARVARIPDETLDEKLSELNRILEQGKAFGGLDGNGHGAFYRLDDSPEFPYTAPARRRKQRSRGSRGRGRG